MDEQKEKLINELRKIVGIYVDAAGNLVQEINWMEDEFNSTDPIEYRSTYADCQFKYRKVRMEKVTNLKKAWKHEQEIWKEIIDYCKSEEEES